MAHGELGIGPTNMAEPESEPTLGFYVGAIEKSLDSFSDEIELLWSDVSFITKNDCLQTVTPQHDGAFSSHGKELEAVLNRILILSNRITNLRASLDR